MRILIINKYLYPKGGDAISTLTTGSILSKNDHEVIYWGMNHPNNPSYPYSKYFVSNIDYDRLNGTFSKAKVAIKILYSFEARKRISDFLSLKKPDFVHLNNIYHQISPSILDIIKKHHIPVVMTMRDYKLVCPTYNMISNGKFCEKCRKGRYYHCLLKRCTKGNLFKSLVNVAEMYLHHRALRIYDNIDLFISPSRFLIKKFKDMGFKKEVVYLPNCIEDTEFTPAYKWQDQNIVYVGRLSDEKGVLTLIDAVKDIPNLSLKIIGEGPLKSSLDTKIVSDCINNIELLGYKSGEELHNEIKKSMFIVIPSEWYENNPRTVIEAFALGKPVVGARIGGIPELVRDWETGLTYESGNVYDLKEKIRLMLRYRNRIPEMGKNARRYVENELNSDVHYKKLMDLYQLAAEKYAFKQKSAAKIS